MRAYGTTKRDGRGCLLRDPPRSRGGQGGRERPDDVGAQRQWGYAAIRGKGRQRRQDRALAAQHAPVA